MAVAAWAEKEVVGTASAAVSAMVTVAAAAVAVAWGEVARSAAEALEAVEDATATAMCRRALSEYLKGVATNFRRWRHRRSEQAM